MENRTIGIVVNGRLQSTRCPQKLIRNFAGTTLFEIAMKKLAKLSANFNVYAGVAEKELIDIVDRYPEVKKLERSLEAVRPGYGAHEKVYEHYGWIEEDLIMWLNPCHPLLSPDTIVNSIKIVENSAHPSYTSVVKTSDWIFNNEGLPLTNRSAETLSTAHSTINYKVAHAFHFIRKKYFLKTSQVWTLTKNDPNLIEIPEEENFDVNTETEFFIAEKAYEKYTQVDK